MSDAPSQTTDLGSLRGWAKQVAIEAEDGWDDEMVAQMMRAAAEIEQLRAALEEISLMGFGSVGAMRRVAKEALAHGRK